MLNYNKIHTAQILIVEPTVEETPTIEETPIVTLEIKPIVVEEKPTVEPIIEIKPIVKDTSFTPFQKDKLFWCFYVLLNGFTEYEMHRTGHYAIEKAFKISSVEKLRTMKTQIKDLKLKISEVEDELVNKEQITVKALQVLCLVYNVSVTYIYGKKYCEFLYSDSINIKKGTIKRNERREHSLLYEEVPDLVQTHWYIENVQKPLKAPTAYTLKDLQDICEKLDIPLKNAMGKNKLKKDLYEDILTKL